jgi:glycosyltransferase involved in cell wall biosynthesis
MRQRRATVARKAAVKTPAAPPAIMSLDPQNCTVEREGLGLLQDLVRESAQHAGPIIEVGTLLGVTATHMALVKQPGQKIVTVDKYCWNPWGLMPDKHFALARQVLHYLIETGHVEQVWQDKNEFYANYAGPPPAMVFLDAVHNYEETKRDIDWAISVGARIIAGHDYCDRFPGVMQAVDEHGGIARLAGSVWQLRHQAATTAVAGVAAVAAPAEDVIQYNGKQLVRGLVSIVMPAYNATEFISLALVDIAKQSYREWELIIVEDGSRDDSEAIVQRFQREHPEHRVFYYRKPKNTGVSNTRNIAFTHCRGEFIAFLDADDRWAPEHLERKLKFLSKRDTDLVYSRVEMFDSDTDDKLCVWGIRRDEIESFPESMYRRPFLQPSGVVIRHSLALDVGGFNEEMAFGEDYDYYFRALALGKQFVFDKKVTSRYRKNHESAATTDRLTLCYEATAVVSHRYLDALPGKRRGRLRTVAKNFLKAGASHMATKPSKRNGCHPDKAVDLLLQAWLLRKYRPDYLAYYLLARFAKATGRYRVFRHFFKRLAK